MAGFKKGKYKQENDLWAKAGGRSKLVKAFAKHGVGKGKANWSTLAVHIFNFHPPNEKLAKWMQTVFEQEVFEDRCFKQTEVLVNIYIYIFFYNV